MANQFEERFKEESPFELRFRPERTQEERKFFPPLREYPGRIWSGIWRGFDVPQQAVLRYAHRRAVEPGTQVGDIGQALKETAEYFGEKRPRQEPPEKLGTLGRIALDPVMAGGIYRLATTLPKVPGVFLRGLSAKALEKTVPVTRTVPTAIHPPPPTASIVELASQAVRPKPKPTEIFPTKTPPSIEPQLVKVYRGITGKEKNRILVTTDETIAKSHGKTMIEAYIDRNKLKSGPEELAFYDRKVPKGKIGSIEAWAKKDDLIPTHKVNIPQPTPTRPPIPPIVAGPTTDINKLRSVVDTMTTPAQSVRERMDIGQSLSSTMSRTKDTASNAWARLKGMGTGLWNAYTKPPIVTDYKRALGTYLADRTYHERSIDKFARSVVERIPRDRQEAILNYVQANGDIAILKERASTHINPVLAKGYERAIHLTGEEVNLANEIRTYWDSKLDEAIQTGLLDHGVQNYAYQIYERQPRFARSLTSEANLELLRKDPAFAKKRVFDSYFDAEMKGFKPKDKSIGFVISAYDKAFAEALHSRQFIDSLKTFKADDGRALLAPRGEKEFFIGDYGKIDHPGLSGLRVHPDLLQPWVMPGQAKLGYPNLKNVLSASRIRRHPLGQPLLTGVATAKGTILSMIPVPFHQVQTGTHAMFHMVDPAITLRPLDELFSRPLTRELIERGLMAHSSHALQEFGEGIAAGGLIHNIPVIGPFQKKYGQYLFNDYIPRLKISMAHKAFEDNLGWYGRKLSRDQILELSANQANSAFGELNYEWMGRNKTMQDVLKLGLFAPDFLESRARFAGQSLAPWHKEQTYALARGALGMFGAARVLNMLTNDGDPKWREPFGWVVGDRVYTIRSIPGDIEHLYDKPGSFIYYRVNPTTVRTTIEALSGRDQFGRKRNVGEMALDFIRAHEPIPLQGPIEAAKKVFEDRGFTTENVEPILRGVLQSTGIVGYKMKQEKSPPEPIPPMVRRHRGEKRR